MIRVSHWQTDKSSPGIFKGLCKLPWPDPKSRCWTSSFFKPVQPARITSFPAHAITAVFTECRGLEQRLRLDFRSNLHSVKLGQAAWHSATIGVISRTPNERCATTIECRPLGVRASATTCMCCLLNRKKRNRWVVQLCPSVSCRTGLWNDGSMDHRKWNRTCNRHKGTAVALGFKPSRRLSTLRA